MSGCASVFRKKEETPPQPTEHDKVLEGDQFDYVVVGSGAGGGPLAANLALEGFRVLLLEAGGDDEPCDYQVPAFHTKVSEHEDLRWDFFVRHYTDDEQQVRDSKFVPEQNGVLYPRSGTLGGCTAHNAMILICPHNSDWNYIAELTGDESWLGDNMRRYFERIENCTYESAADKASRHGFKGWLPTSMPDVTLLLNDKVLLKLATAALAESINTIPKSLSTLMARLKTRWDPNDWRYVRSKRQDGLTKIPLTTLNGKRRGSREFIKEVQAKRPNKLIVRPHALATRILLDENKKAIGIEYLKGAHQYRADPRSGTAPEGTREKILVEREVIISAGAFNTPQLLKLSGIGPKAELERHGIEVKVDLPGVGENLQDRYEVCVTTRLKKNIPLISGMTLRCPEPGEEPDPLFREWLQHRGPYTGNGAVVGLMKHSSAARAKLDPDLLIFGLIGDFHGYFPGYSKLLTKGENYFSWAILKAHTTNRTGQVILRSNDPRDRPDVNFHYFSDCSSEDPDNCSDLDAVVVGIKTARSINARCRDLIEEEIIPGPRVQSNEDLRRFVRDEAWGHHASCTCQIGPRSNPMAVVDSRFRVYGTENLRIVDASVFPKIPGFFIASAIYMISEKAKDVILEDARQAGASRSVA